MRLTVYTASGQQKVATIASYSYVAITADYAVAATDYMVDITSGNVTVTLPTAVGITGRQYVIKNSGTGTITIATTSSQTIDGQTTRLITFQWTSLTIMSDGSNWKLV